MDGAQEIDSENRAKREFEEFKILVPDLREPNNEPLGYENYGAKHDRKIRPREDARKDIVRAFKLFSTGEYSISSLSDELRDSACLPVGRVLNPITDN